MVIRKSPKSKKYRGSTTHGWGSMKKRRGAGNRGGRGNAGTGKKANTKVASMWKERIKLGKFGFKKKGAVSGKCVIGISQLEQALPGLVKAGKATEAKDMFTVDLTKLGYDKLVGTGKATKKMTIVVGAVSKTAVEKIQGVGGSVETKAKPEEAEKTAPKPKADVSAE